MFHFIEILFGYLEFVITLTSSSWRANCTDSHDPLPPVLPVGLQFGNLSPHIVVG